MNKSVTIISICSIATMLSCSKEPYEEEISQYFQSKVKVVPIIDEIKIDTSASMESYRDYWIKKVDERREYLINNLERDYNSSKSSYEGYVERYKRFPNDFWKKGMNREENEMNSNKAQLDSASKGVFSDARFNIMNRLKDDKSEFHQLTVKYKLSNDGATLIQRFVIQNDSIVYPTEKDLDFFISFFYQTN